MEPLEDGTYRIERMSPHQVDHVASHKMWTHRIHCPAGVRLVLDGVLRSLEVTLHLEH